MITISDVEMKAVVLAAGKGTRLISSDNDAPKVMRTACGKPLLWYVLDAISFLDKKDIVLVVGYKKEMVTDYFDGYVYAEQTEQLGTGHAVMAAESALRGFEGAILVCYGDMPLIKQETYEAFVHYHFDRDNDCTILTGESANDLPYGRILRDDKGEFDRVVEARDCTPEQLMITELNSGVCIFRSALLFEALKNLNTDNTQKEYYLTDVPAIMRSGGARIGLCKRDLGDEIIGVNTIEQLAIVEGVISGR